MTLWFGESWHAPICADGEHVQTPVGDPCLYCEEPIEADDQGVRMPHAKSETEAVIVSAHLDCFLQTVLPHGPECWRCRGLERSQHKMSCSYAKHGGDCDCPFGAAALRVVTGGGTVGEAAKQLEMSDRDLMDRLSLWSHRRNALKQCRRTPHNPPDDSGERKA